MGEQKEPTRSELAEALARSNALLEEQGKFIEELRAKEPKAGDPIQLEMLKLLMELRDANRAPGAKHYMGPELKKVPYEGFVRATEPWLDNIFTLTDGKGDWHPVKREVGEICQVERDQLWTDDPFEPVTLKGSDESGKPIVVRNEEAMKTRADFRFRRHAALKEEPELKRASEY